MRFDDGGLCHEARGGQHKYSFGALQVLLDDDGVQGKFLEFGNETPIGNNDDKLKDLSQQFLQGS